MKKLFAILLSALFLVSLARPVLADDFSGGENWQVVLEPSQKMTSNFTSADIDKVMSAIEPGDTATFTVNIVNNNQETAAWYLANEVLYSLEDRSNTASGGAYEYILTYTNSAGVDTVLFSSDTVGGEGSDRIRDGEGLHGADSALKDFFFLDNLKTGDKAKVTLVVALDGESQGNSYQDTMADLQIRFAAEFVRPGGTTVIVETGETAILWVWFAAMLFSGAALLFVVITRIRKNRKEAAV